MVPGLVRALSGPIAHEPDGAQFREVQGVQGRRLEPSDRVCPCRQPLYDVALEWNSLRGVPHRFEPGTACARAGPEFRDALSFWRVIPNGKEYCCGWRKKLCKKCEIRANRHRSLKNRTQGPYKPECVNFVPPMRSSIKILL